MKKFIPTIEDFINEESKSVAQQRLFGMAWAVRKGSMKKDEVPESVLKIVDSDMTDEQIKDYAKTSHTGLPMKKENEYLTEKNKIDDPRAYHNEFVKKIKKIKGVQDVWEVFEDPNKYGDTTGTVGFKYNYKDKFNHTKGEISVDYSAYSIFIRGSMPPYYSLKNTSPKKLIDLVKNKYSL